MFAWEVTLLREMRDDIKWLSGKWRITRQHPQSPSFRAIRRNGRGKATTSNVTVGRFFAPSDLRLSLFLLRQWTLQSGMCGRNAAFRSILPVSWAPERPFRSILYTSWAPERLASISTGPGTPFRCVPAYFNPWVGLQITLHIYVTLHTCIYIYIYIYIYI
jgi:hypothetical protein